MSTIYTREYEFGDKNFNLDEFVTTARKLGILYIYENTKAVQRISDENDELYTNGGEEYFNYSEIQFCGKSHLIKSWDILEKLIPKPYKLLMVEDVDGEIKEDYHLVR